MSPVETVIDADRRSVQYWKDLWRFRELFYFLAWRDIRVRYKQAALGISWSLLRPVMTMLIFTFVFGKLARLPTDGTPYPILVFAGLLPWQFVANAMSESSMSLVNNANLVSKVYFPRLIVPTSTVIVSFIDFLISLALFGLLLVYYAHPLSWRFLALPVFTAIGIAGAIGAGLWFSALTVKYRDFRFIVPFVVQIGLYLSPVGYLSSVVPDQWRLVYALNPVVGIIDGFRWAILGTPNDYLGPSLLISLSFVVLVFTSGLWFFRRTERSFADVI